MFWIHKYCRKVVAEPRIVEPPLAEPPGAFTIGAPVGATTVVVGAPVDVG